MYTIENLIAGDPIDECDLRKIVIAIYKSRPDIVREIVCENCPEVC